MSWPCPQERSTKGAARCRTSASPPTRARSRRRRPAPPKLAPATARSDAPAEPAASSTERPFEPKPPTDDELRKVAEDQFDAESVRMIVETHMPQVRACYEHAFKINSPGGRVEIAFTHRGLGPAEPREDRSQHHRLRVVGALPRRSASRNGSFRARSEAKLS